MSMDYIVVGVNGQLEFDFESIEAITSKEFVNAIRRITSNNRYDVDRISVQRFPSSLIVCFRSFDKQYDFTDLHYFRFYFPDKYVTHRVVELEYLRYMKCEGVFWDGDV